MKLVVVFISCFFFVTCAGKSSSDRAYTLGEEIVFSKSGNADKYKMTGWSFPEATHTWIDGKSAGMLLSLNGESGKDKLVMQVTCLPFIVKGNSQFLGIKVNGSEVAKLEMKEAVQAEYFVEFGSELVTNDIVQIDFMIPNAKQPSSLDKNNPDSRTLGVAFVNLKLY